MPKVQAGAKLSETEPVGREAALARVHALVGDRLVAVEREFASYLSSEIPLIAEIGRYISQSGGKRIRPALLLLTSRLGRYTGDGDVLFASVFELIHTATLVHDDVIDGATMRRGQRSVNAEWGNHVTVLLGDYLYIKSMQMALTADDIRFIKVLADITLKMIEGELIQADRNGRVDVSEDEYLDLIRRKTAFLFSGCCRVGAMLSGQEEAGVEDLAAYGLHLGMAFQIIDDVLDLTGTAEELGKPVASDLRDGKVTLPLIYLLEKDPSQRDRVAAVLEAGSFDGTSREELLSALAETGSLDRTRRLARDFAARALSHLESFPQSPVRDCLTEMPSFVVHRQR